MKLKYLFIILSFLPLCLFGQRHYKGVAGIEGSFGSRLSGQTFDPVASLYYSAYTGYKTFWKFGFNYWDTEIKVSGKYPEHSHFFNTEFRIGYTIVPANEFLFINVLGGGFLGLERLDSFSKYKDPTQQPNVEFPSKFKKNRFIAGGAVGLEFEFFVSQRIGLIINVSEYFSPMSKVEKWHTTATAGVKFLIY